MGAEVVKSGDRSRRTASWVGRDRTTTPGKERGGCGLETGAWVSLEVAISADLEGTLCQPSQAVSPAARWGSAWWIFTHPKVVYEHTRAAIAYGVHPVIGTTGLSPKQLAI